MNTAKIASEELFLRYAEELNRRGHLKEYSAVYFTIEGIREISEQYGYKEAQKVRRQYRSYLLRFLENDEFMGHLEGDNYVALVKMWRTSTFRSYVSDVELDTVQNGKVLNHHISATCGIWEMSEEVRDIREVINTPSLAFVEAKYILYQPYVEVPAGQVARVNQQNEVTAAFHEALSNGEFMVYYQPKMDVEKNALCGAEALVRWKRDGQIIYPGVFIRPLEQTGDITEMDYFVLRTICRDIKRWQAAGITPVPVSVNCSRKNLMDEDLAENIDVIITKSGVDKSLVEVEIREISNNEEYDFMADFFAQLQERGVNTAIDNFGSGYASLQALKNFSVHTIKIDRSFINSDDFSQEDETLLRHVVQMAKELGVGVVTQGVEREDQLAFVKSVGCTVIQGYYYDRPLPPEEFEKRLRS